MHYRATACSVLRHHARPTSSARADQNPTCVHHRERCCVWTTRVSEKPWSGVRLHAPSIDGSAVPITGDWPGAAVELGKDEPPARALERETKLMASRHPTVRRNCSATCLEVSRGFAEDERTRGPCSFRRPTRRAETPRPRHRQQTLPPPHKRSMTEGRNASLIPARESGGDGEVSKSIYLRRYPGNGLILQPGKSARLQSHAGQAAQDMSPSRQARVIDVTARGFQSFWPLTLRLAPVSPR